MRVIGPLANLKTAACKASSKVGGAVTLCAISDAGRPRPDRRRNRAAIETFDKARAHELAAGRNAPIGSPFYGLPQVAEDLGLE